MNTDYLNTPKKGCQTCFFKYIDGYQWRCGRSGTGCVNQRQVLDKDCDENFSGWQPIPPKPKRRSLRQWLYDTFLA